VLASLLDSVYELEVTCLDDYDEARAVIELAEKWDFDHVVKLIKNHFHSGKCDASNLSVKRFTLAMALNMKDPAKKCVETWQGSSWGASSTAKSEKAKAFPQARGRYLRDNPVEALMPSPTLPQTAVFDLGTWGYKIFLELPPTTVWAILRARHLATTVPCVVDGTKFQAEFGKLLDIIMPVSTLMKELVISLIDRMSPESPLRASD
jgi:hypothetical protein